MKKQMTTTLYASIDFLQIRDVNDNAPVWATPSVSIRLNRSRDDAVDLSATDADAGEREKRSNNNLTRLIWNLSKKKKE